MTQSKTTNAGPVGMKPKGDYSASAPYTYLDCVKYNHDSWVCKALDAQGNPVAITGQAPADGSQYWHALTDGGRAAVAVGNQVRTDFDDWFGATVNAGIRKTVNDWLSSVQDAWTAWFSDTLVTGVRKIWATWFGGVQGEWETLSDDVTTATGAANDAAENARVRADYARAQGEYAKQLGDEAALVDVNVNGTVLTVTNRSGQTTSVDTKGDKGDDLDYSTLTEEEKSELNDTIVQHIVSENILGPTYDDEEHGFDFPVAMHVQYDAVNHGFNI